MLHQKATRAGRILILSLFLVTSILTSASFATPIDVSYSVSGSAYNWILNFSVTNNLGNTNLIYLFGVNPLGTGDRITGSPDQWSERSPLEDPSQIQYSYSWYNINNLTRPGANFISDGQTLSGFSVLDTELDAPTSVNWMAYAKFGTYTGSDYFFNIATNPGFEGIAKDSPAAVPEPSTFHLFTAGLAAVGFFRRKI